MSSGESSAVVPSMSMSGEQDVAGFCFANSYARLPEHFFARLDPARVVSPRLVHLNRDLAERLNLDPDKLAGPQGVAVLAGNRVAKGSEPLAMAYAGHQFGHFVPQLGDGRANLLGELLGRDGRRYDLQLKGSGRTPFSRGGDGQAALGPVLREYLVSEAMAALDVPTTRALAAVTTGERVIRDAVLPGAVLARVAASHLRVGTFQYFAARGDSEGVRRLADYAIARFYPECATAERPYLAFLDAVIARQAQLIAHWLLLGFVHGVMNTDNMSISGETLDYGPCAFLEAYDPDMVFSSIDHRGRYSYSNQPHAAHWNLARLAETLLPLLSEGEGGEEGALTAARESLARFGTRFEAARLAGWRRKLGLVTEQDGDGVMVEDLLGRMAEHRADFTRTFRLLCDAAAEPHSDLQVRHLFADPGAFDTWAAGWRHRLREEPTSAEEREARMRAVNPAFIPRNHLVQAALHAATQDQDFRPFEDLLAVVTRPYDDRPDLERFSTPALAEECVTQTFCGT